MEKIIKVPENEYETVFSQELQKYNPHLTKIRNTFPEQSTLLKSITVTLLSLRKIYPQYLK
jgi:hypothetical protein